MEDLPDSWEDVEPEKWRQLSDLPDAATTSRTWVLKSQATQTSETWHDQHDDGWSECEWSSWGHKEWHNQGWEHHSYGDEWKRDGWDDGYSADKSTKQWNQWRNEGSGRQSPQPFKRASTTSGSSKERRRLQLIREQQGTPADPEELKLQRLAAMGRSRYNRLMKRQKEQEEKMQAAQNERPQQEAWPPARPSASNSSSANCGEGKQSDLVKRKGKGKRTLPWEKDGKGTKPKRL